MTLGDLYRKLREVGDQFNSYEIPLIDDDWNDIDVIVEAVQDSFDKKYYVKIVDIPNYQEEKK